MFDLQGGALVSDAIYVNGDGVFRAEWGSLGGGINKSTIFTGAVGKTLVLDSGWRNEGVIKHSAGTLEFRGVNSTGDIGVIERTGGQVVISGTMFNTGTILESGAWSGPLLITGRIEGGTLIAGASAPITLSNGQMYGVTIGGGSISTLAGLRTSNLSIASGAKLEVNTSIIFGRGTTASAELLGGSGKLVLQNARVTKNVSGTSVTFGSDVTVSGSGTISILGLVNNGTLIAGGNSLNLDGNWTNNGLLTAADGAVLNIIGEGHLGPLSRFDSGTGQIRLSAPVHNIGQTLALNGSNNLLQMYSFFEGGTIQSTGGARILVAGNSASMHNVFIDSDMTVTTGDIPLIDGTTMAPGRQALMEGGRIIVEPGFSGEVNFTSPTTPAAVRNTDLSNFLGTADVVIRTAGGSGSIEISGDNARFDGLMSAESPNHSLWAGYPSNTMTNYGRMQVSAGTLATLAKFVNQGSISVLGGTFDITNSLVNNGTIAQSGGRVNFGGVVDPLKIGTFVRGGGSVALTGTLNNATMTSGLTDAIGPWVADGSATIIGGSIVPPEPGQPLPVIGGRFTVDGAALDTDVVLASGSVLNLRGAWTQHGLISGSNATVTLNGTFTGDDFGSISMTNSTVDVAGTLNNAGRTLRVDYGPGTAATLRGGRIIGGTIGEAGKLINLASGTLDSVTLVADAKVIDRTVTVVNGITIAPGVTIDMTAGILEFAGAQTVDGLFQVVFDGTGSASIPSFRAASASTLTLGANALIRTGTSRGFVGATNRRFISNGTLSSRTSGADISMQGTFTNNGLVEARNGGAVGVSATTLTNYSAGSLNGGRWAAYANSTIALGQSGGTFDNIATITINNSNVLLDGLNSTFQKINSIRTNLGRFTIDHGRDFVTAGSLSSSGFLGIGTNSTLYVSGPLTNTGSIDLTGTIIVNYNPGDSESVIFDALVGQIGTAIFSSQTDPTRAIGSAENSVLGYLTFHGKAVDATSVLLALTFFGDANLDGVADLADFDRFLGGYGPSAVAPSWVDGDFDYSGVVDLVDFERYLNGYYALGGSMQAISDAVKGSGLPESDQDAMLALVATVPEPISVGLLGLLTPWSLKRPRRR